MSAATEIAALRNELEQLKATLELYFEGLSREHFTAWRKAKRAVASGEMQSDDTTVGRNLPAVPTKTQLNNIGGATTF